MPNAASVSYPPRNTKLRPGTAASAIDILTEESQMKSVMTLLDGKTEIAVAHRLDSINSLGPILVFREGKIEESGDFEEITNNQDYFYDLRNRSSLPRAADIFPHCCS